MSIVETFEKFFRDPRMVYLVIFVLSFAGALAPLDLPAPADYFVKGAYDFVEKLKPGDVVMVMGAMGNDMERGSNSQTVALLKHVISRGCDIIYWSSWYETLYVYDRELYPLLYNVTAIGDSPLYGTKIVDLGYLIGFRTVIIYTLARDIRSYCTVDRYGTPLDDLPMMKDLNDASKIKLFITIGTGAPPACWQDPIGAFKVGYGTACIGVAEGECLTEIAWARQIGLLEGLVYGVIGGREYTKLTGIPGIGQYWGTQVFYVCLFVIVGTIISNWYQLVYKKRRGG